MTPEEHEHCDHVDHDTHCVCWWDDPDKECCYCGQNIPNEEVQ